MWQMHRHHMLNHRYGPIETGTVVSVEHGWAETFAILPHRTIGGRWVWLKKIYCRRVWVYTGFIDEPETQYGTLFDILRLNYEQERLVKRDWCNIPVKVLYRSPGQWRDLRIWLMENVDDMDYDAAGVDLQDYNRRVIYFARSRDAMWFALRWS